MFAERISGQYEATDKNSETSWGAKNFSVEKLAIDISSTTNGTSLPELFVADPANLDKWQTFFIPLEGARGLMIHREFTEGRFLTALGTIWFETYPDGSVNYNILEGKYRYEGARNTYTFKFQRKNTCS